MQSEDHGPLDPAELYERCRSAPQRVRAEAYQQLGGLLHRLVAPRVIGDPRLQGLAADAAQEALVTIWRELESGRGPDAPESFVSWSIRIAVNKLIDMRRQLEPKGEAGVTKRVALSRQVRLDEPTGDLDRSPAERLADPNLDALDVGAAHAELQATIRSIGVLSCVSEASKTVLLKGYLEGWPDDELATLLGTTRGNVHVIRCRDLQRLRNDTDFVSRLRSAIDPGD